MGTRHERKQQSALGARRRTKARLLLLLYAVVRCCTQLHQKKNVAYALCTFKQEDVPNVCLLRTIGLLDSVLARASSESLSGGSTRVRLGRDCARVESSLGVPCPKVKRLSADGQRSEYELVAAAAVAAGNTL
jgi:hypothetical protein